jgi:anti-sigma factor RsiW
LAGDAIDMALTCHDVTDFLADYAAGALSVDVASAFERHLERCPNCQVFLQQYRDSIAASRAALADGVPASPAEVPEELVRAIVNSLTDTP